MQVESRVQQVERRAEELRTPGPLIDGVRRLIVVRHDRLGDLVLTLPAVDALRRAYPTARLALMVRADLAPLARMVPVVDDVLPAHPDRARLREEIVGYEADLLVSISRGAGISRVAIRAGVRERIGTGYRIYSPLFTRTVSERRSPGKRHEAEYALSFAHRAGAEPGPAVFPLAVAKPARSSIAEWLTGRDVDGPFVVIHPGSGGSCPRWPVESFVELAALLRSRGLRVVFSIGPEDAECERTIERAGAQVRESPRYSLGLELLPALLQSAALVISNSTGPLHLAAALDCPTLGLYAPWPTCGVTRWGPYSEQGRALVAECAEAMRWSRGERRRRGDELLAAIPAATVADCALGLLGQ
jgi:ADP-heptose:LPS heptosyltransferase